MLQAAGGEEGRQFAQTHRPDVIVMDIQLPDVSGLDIIKRLKQDDGLKAIPVIAVTAFAMAGDRETYLGAGSDGYLSKPVSISDLLHTVAAAADGSFRPDKRAHPHAMPLTRAP